MKIKRRVILSLLITITIAILTNKCWLLFNPISVSFGIYGQGKCNVQVLLNKKDNVDFKKIKSAEDSIILTDVSTVDLKVYRAKRPKRLRIILSDMNATDNIVITNLRVDKFLVSNLADFEVKGAKILIEDKKLVVHPNNAVVMLTYKNPLNVKARIKLDYMIFVTILVLTYLFSYKLTNYVADFKTIQNKSRIDILFLTLFFIFLFIPMSHINDKEISEQENRTLAKWSPLLNDNGELNFNFGKNFNEWFNDRFNFRYVLISYHNYIYSKFSSILKTPKAIYNKKTNWMLVDSNEWYSPAFFNKETQSLIVNNLRNFNSFCNLNNIKFYLLIVPHQQEVYYEQGDPYLVQSVVESRMGVVREIKDQLDMPVIFAYDSLREASQNLQTFYKTDWHWTDDGAYIGYELLLNAIKKDFTNVTTLSKKEFNTVVSNKVRSDWDRKFHNGEVMMYHFHDFEKFADKILDKKYTYYEYKNKEFLKEQVIDDSFKKEKIYHYESGADLRLLQMGTSMNESLLQFMPYSFRDLKYIRLINVLDMPQQESFKIMKYYKNNILEFKPDIVVLCLTPSNLIGAIDFFKE